MGNNNSGHAVGSQVPPPWTQSLPRDVHRQKKYGAIQGTKVLPERIPGQRLKPTENGRNLQSQGTITTRRTSELTSLPPGYPPPLVNHHSSSMTALNHPPIQAPSAYYHPTSISIHDPRFGPAPPKSFASEPDLRGSSPTSHMSLPIPVNAPHTVISESPTKGKIKSKKRYKAPLPPAPVQASISLPLERSQYVPSPNMSMENWSNISSPPAKSSKSKPKKIGLFKKKTESRMSNYETEYPTLEGKSKHKEKPRVEGKGKQKERSTTPVPIQISSKKELKERARSLDNLQHEIRRSPQGLTGSVHSLEVIGNADKENHWPEVPYENQMVDNSPDNRKISTLEREANSDAKERKERRMTSTLERESRGHRRLSTVERKLHERQLEERRSEGILSSPVGDPKRFEPLQSRSSTEYHRSSSSCSSCRDNHLREAPKDEWDLAEEEWLEKKKKSEDLQKEIINAAKNLRKTSVSPEQVPEDPINRNIKKEKDISTIQITSLNEQEFENEEDSPKTFFFGMEPGESAMQSDLSHTKTALAKLNEQEEIKIIGSTVEYSRHSLKPKEKKRNLERDSWNRSLDYRDKARSRSREKEVDENTSKVENKKKISREIDEFVATIERGKLKHKTSDEFSNSISRKGDGGYHSRQNSGSFHLETEGSDDDNIIRMKLRPTLPRRQLELPRFSPNAAWRSLSVETTSRQKEVHTDININDEVFSIGEDQIHRYTRPTAPPRTSGEKSADSGISGDAGSPGPMQEFEPLTPEKLKTSSGPLAVSSPVASARLDLKRAWTPAQDLDDNSFEENGEQNGKGSFHQEVSTLPKLTSRTNMFSKPVMLSSPEKETSELRTKGKHKEMEASFNEKDLPDKAKHRNEDYQVNARSLQRVKPVSSSPRKNEAQNINEDNWRENWSMSRSIPNSLNTCDEPDCVSNSDRPCRSRSESRMSLNQSSENRGHISGSKPVTPGYLHGNSGHIMYLPEYKSYQMGKTETERRVINEYMQQEGYSKYPPPNYNECPSTPEQERKSPSGDENPGEPESSRWHSGNMMATGPEPMPNGNRFIVLNGKKNKKFSYQSTVRMMEKKKLEEKLSKEVEEKEKRRLREVEAMMKVEQEFQKKREREKKRLKKQLQFFQEQQASPSVEHNTSSEENTFFNQSFHPHQVNQYDASSDTERPPPLPSSPPPFPGHRQMSSYQSLPMETGNGSSPFENNQSNQHHQSGLFSGLKKWVKGKKDVRSGYLSDASSVTVTSSSRQEPDGAPASSPGRKNFDNIRAEIIAASRHRNGTPIMDREMAPDHCRNKSPAPSVVSKESHLRTVTPDSKRAISPDSRKSISSEMCPLTQELPEMRQEQRQYREYRRSSKKPLMPNIMGHMRQSHKAASVTHNYRRDFCLGNVSGTPIKVYQNDDGDKYLRHSNESRKSKQSNPKRNSSVDIIVDSEVIPTNSLRRQYSSPNDSKSPVPIPIPPNHDSRHSSQHGNRVGGNHLPKGYQSPHITPYNPNKGYRPVSFSPPPGKILTVT